MEASGQPGAAPADEPPPLAVNEEEIVDSAPYGDDGLPTNGRPSATGGARELSAEEPDVVDEAPDVAIEMAVPVDAFFAPSDAVAAEGLRPPPPPPAPSDMHRPSMPPPPPPPRAHHDAAHATPAPDDGTTLNDNGIFRQEAQALARARDWQKLAAITSAAIDHATWVTLPETRAALLLDLARIHRDRLADPQGAEEAFRRLAQVDPTNEDALEYLSKTYRERGDWRAIYDLYSAAVEPTWDPNQRLQWTRETAEIATERLRAPDLAIEAWERLERLGDAATETYRALSEMYRRARRWDRLAQFLGKRAAQLQGTERIVALREVAEAYLSGLRDHQHAGYVLEQILTARPDDTIALLAYARVLARQGDWAALAALGERSLEGVPRAVVLDFRRVVADALWNADQRDEAMEIYARVLEVDPDDADAVAAKERYLAEQPTRAGELVDFLVARAARSKSDEASAEVLGRAAQLAEDKLGDAHRAAELWERRAKLPSGQLAAHQALERIYDRLGDLAGVARCLEGQLALTRNPGARVELLRRLGEHSAHRLGDDDRAEACWKEIISIVPNDRRTQDELMALHRRRGNFEALDQALAGRAFRTADKEELLDVWRVAAKNVEENLRDPKRAVAAWNRVLDLAPHDGAALAARVGHHRTLANRRDLIASLEAELRGTRDPVARRERALEVARLWEQEGARVAALAAYERVLRWDHSDETALAALERLHAGNDKELGSAIAALEVAAAVRGARGEDGERIRLLRHALSLGSAQDKLGRFLGLRRVLWLSGRDPGVLGELEKAAAEAGAWAELAEVYRALASEAPHPSARAALHKELAIVYEERLLDPVRAFLVLQASERRPIESGEVLAELTRLADITKRHEDLLAILDGSAGAEQPPETRKAMLRRRAVLLEAKLSDATRAFAECVRLLQLDPHDPKALEDARRIAEGKGLWRALDALYAELGDRSTSDAERVSIAMLRHAVRDAKLKDARGALDQLIGAYRLDPDHEGLSDRLLAATEKEHAWDRVLPVIEAKVRAVGDGASPDELTRLAALHEHQRKDTDRAFDLYAEAFALRPEARDVDEDVRRLAEADGRWAELAATYRAAAARAESTPRKLELLRRVADLAAGRLRDDQAALDAHGRILQLDPASLSSLVRVIEYHREKGEWRDLRDRLQQWVEQAPEAERPARIPRWLEIASISRDRLGDHEVALGALERVLEVDPGHTEALEAVRSLGALTENPRFELRRLRIELPRADAQRRVEIQLACARIERTRLDDTPAAIETLRALAKDTGAAGPAFEPLAALLRETGRWAELAELMVARAEHLPHDSERVAALEQGIAVYEEHLPDAPLEKKEALFKRLLAERPDDGETRRRLLSLYRDAGRQEELAAALREAIAAPGSPDERTQFEAELFRVLTLALDRESEAVEVLGSNSGRRATGGNGDGDSEALLARAQGALRKGDFVAWLDARQQHARKLDPVHGALVLCHLAEACDETAGQQLRTAGLYREARALDPHNAHATEALKAIGRRAKNWRTAAALLPEPDEMKLSPTERSRRLAAIGEQALKKSLPDTARAGDYLLRAVAVDPDNYTAWDRLGDLRTLSGDHPKALTARAASLAAYERSVAPAPRETQAHVARIEALAAAARAAGKPERAAALSLQAHRLQPTYPAAALAVADIQLKAGQSEAAYALFDRVLRGAASAARLDDEERLHATYGRGALALRLGRREQATADLQTARTIDPLHGGVLRSLAEALDESGRVGDAATHYVQALLVEPEARARGTLYARLGRLLEDKLSSGEEAGVCYDLSIAASPEGDIGDREVLSRALQHYRRQGRLERALAVIERILPTIDDPREQAALWTERGSILAAAGDEDHAMEAFDMALSYDPGSRGAITGLSRILEKRGDWEQLAQIFEARTETGSPEERSEALRALARMALSHLKDPARGEKYLRAVVDLAPTREDFEQLLALYGDDPANKEGRMLVLSGLLGLGGPYMPRVIEFGKGLVSQGDRRWAWCVLSPLMNSTLSEPLLKATVLELRKEFEKSDNSGVLSPHTHELAQPASLSQALAEVVAELDAAVTLGRATVESTAAAGTGKLDERTAVGKNFAAIAARVGLEGTLLTRAQELSEPYMILDGDKGHVIVRAELLQLLSVAETGFLFALLLELTRPGIRLLASLREGDRAALVPALFAACGLGEIPAGAAALVESITANTTAEQRAAWADKLRGLHGTPETLGVALYHGLLETARRVGLVAAADLRFAARVITRLDETLPKMQTVGRIDDLDEFIAGTPPVRSLLGFAVTPLFGKLLHGTEAQPASPAPPAAEGAP